MNNSEECLNWYKSQVNVKIDEAATAYEKGDVITGNYLTHEASNYQKRINEMEGSK